MTKTCTKCKIEKELDDFSKFYRHKKYNFKSECKTCAKERTKEWVENNRQRHNQYQLDRYHVLQKAKKTKV